MCGLIVVLRPGGVDPDELRELVPAIEHRGPDGSGVVSIGPVGLVHTRLAIIGLHDAASQPMWSASGRFVGVLNGELYNYAELVKSEGLDQRILHKGSDTEVLLEVFEKNGAEAVRGLRGMYAFAIWDTEENTLYTGRDPLGKKPLYSAHDKNGVVLASELAAAAQFTRPNVDWTGLRQYFRFGYIPEPATIYEQIRSHPPGCIGTWRLGSSPTFEKTWELPRAEKTMARGDAVEECDALLRQAVRRRLVADVPISCFLSGGLDSALIASYVAELSPGTRAITVGVDDGRLDESREARLTAACLDVEHEIETVDAEDPVAALDYYVRTYQQPFADSSGVPTITLCKAASRTTKVALGGDGADELFGGYDRYRWHRQARRLAPLVSAFPRGMGIVQGLVGSRAARALDVASSGGPAAAYQKLSSVWFVEDLPLSPHMNELCVDENLWFHSIWDAGKGSELRRAQEFDIRSYLLNDIFVKVDRASMGQGLEVRSPFLDVDLVEFVSRMGILGSDRELGKKTLRSLLKRRVPNRRFSSRKRGFVLPVVKWLHGPLKAVLNDYADRGFVRSQGIFSDTIIQSQVERFYGGHHSLHGGLWAYLVFQRWYDRFVSGRY